MPRRSKRREEDLVYAAVEALEDEIRCWREGPARPYYGAREDMVMLTRYPSMRMGPIGPADVPEEAITVQHLDLPRKEVPYFLRWKGMEAAIKKLRELERQPERMPSPETLDRMDEMARIEMTGLDAPGFVVMR